MTVVLMELLTDQGNNAVVRLPDRNYPGVVIQGDTLNNLAGMALDAIDALGSGNADEAKALVNELAEHLDAARTRYEAALEENGITLPY